MIIINIYKTIFLKEVGRGGGGVGGGRYINTYV